ncbi:MAG: methyltransferase domain-containing protein [Bacillota bacterium]
MEHIRAFVQEVAKSFLFQEPIIEIGAYLVEGQQELADMRPFFPEKKYIGCDLRMGPGVDRIEDIQKLSFTTSSVNSLLVLETLEHVVNPFKAFEEMYRVLTPKGLLFLSVPFCLPIHEFPSDYWRFTPCCIDMLLRKFHRFICWENSERKPAQAKHLPRTIFAVASKLKLPQDGIEILKRYIAEMDFHVMPEKKTTINNLKTEDVAKKVTAEKRKFK